MIHNRIIYVLLLLAPCPLLQAQNTPLFARPAETFEGDAVIFTYRADKPCAIPLNHIQAWKWDFDGADDLIQQKPLATC